jgi:poly-gamma-glutamate system protein
MKKIYWRPHEPPLSGFILIALLAVAGFLAVEYFPVTGRSPYYQEEFMASNLASQAMALVKAERLRKGIPLDPETDPAQSGLIGLLISPATTDSGDLEAKQTTVNPNFAAVVVDLLKEAGVKEGDQVAVSMTGSFPALNIAVLAAIKALGLKPVIISSVGSSQWGANDPEFLWPDMEKLLYDQGLTPSRSAAASFGGRHDTGKEMSADGRRAILATLERNNVPLINSSGRHENINQRMALYLKNGQPKAYINVGGAVTAVGSRRRWRDYLKSGRLPDTVPPAKRGDFLVYRFLEAGVPVINLENVRQLAARYGLPLSPETIPKVGEGGVYYDKRYNSWLAGVILVLILAGIYVFSRTDFGFRLLQSGSHREGASPPEPMA